MSVAVTLNTAVILTVTFTDALTGAATDPTTVICEVKDPNNTVTTPATSKTSTGVYTATFTVATAGTWTAIMRGTGALVKQTDDFVFTVSRSALP